MGSAGVPALGVSYRGFSFGVRIAPTRGFCRSGAWPVCWRSCFGRWRRAGLCRARSVAGGGVLRFCFGADIRRSLALGAASESCGRPTPRRGPADSPPFGQCMGIAPNEAILDSRTSSGRGGGVRILFLERPLLQRASLLNALVTPRKGAELKYICFAPASKWRRDISATCLRNAEPLHT